MTKPNYTDINFIIDRSGSMSGLADDVIGGFNQLLEDQKKVPGEATVSLYQFDDHYEVNYEAVSIDKVQPLSRDTYVPRGMTALLDAIGRTVVRVGDRLRNLKEEDRPSKVIVVVQTDGYENASREYRADQIATMIKTQETQYSWEFVFLGANQDAVLVGQQYGFQPNKSLTYAATGKGAAAALSSVSARMSNVRSCSTMSMSFTDDDREAQNSLLES